MINSMTGFGRAEKQTENSRITVEIRSVNHRYLDVNIKSPRRFNAFESQIRSVIKEYMSRGKVDAFITWEDLSEKGITLRYNEALARQYITFAECMKEDFDVADDLTVTALMNCPDVLTMQEEKQDEEEQWALLEPVLRAACADLQAARSREGENLREDLLAKLAELRENVGIVTARAPQILEEYKARLLEKTRELLENAQIDEGRIAAEIVLFADKICTDEETVRLTSHIDSMAEHLRRGDEIGRKLDFIAQEMNREANTILSKSNDLQTSEVGIELKTGIEKIREQIQNIE